MEYTFDQIMEFFGWAREQGAVHIQAPGGFSIMLPPPAGDIGNLPEMPEYEEGSLKQWINTPVPLRGPGK
jgi:hypothetical protein